MANPTTNFGWVMPTSSSLVTNLPADFNTFGQAVDTSMSELLGGTTGQVLSKTSNTNMDFTWVTPTDQTPLTSKGDLFTFSTVDARLGVGTDGQTLVADSTASTGLKWATVSSSPTFVGAVAAMSADFNVSNQTFTAVPFAATDYLDTDAFHSTSSNNTRMTIPAGKAGKYWVYAGGFFQSGGTTGDATITIYLNGVTTNGVYTNFIVNSSINNGQRTGAILNLAVGDYVECVVYQNSGGTRVWNDKGTLGLYYLGA